MSDDPNQIPDPNLGPTQGPVNVSPTDKAPEEEFEVRHKWYRYIEEKYIFIPLAIFLLIPIIGVLIITRYDTLGLVHKQNYSLGVIDSKTTEPLGGASISLRGQVIKTNNFGEAEFTKLKVGKTQITITKPFYKTVSGTVLITLTNHKIHVFAMSTTGSEQSISVTNRINNSPVNQAVITYKSSTEITNTSGKSIMALPFSTQPLPATITAEGYNPVNVLISESSPNNFQMVPSGKIYYLVGSGGSANVMEANLDGSSPAVVIAGASPQTLANTSLYQSGDLKYLALFTVGSDGVPTASIINTATNKVVKIDSDAQGFKYFGWTTSDTLVYQYTNYLLGSPHGPELKSYDATKNKSYVLDDTEGLGYDSYNYSYQSIAGVDILADGTILYTTTWNAPSQYLLSSYSVTYNSVQPDGTKQTQLASESEANYSMAPTVIFTSPNSVNLVFKGVGAGPIYYTYSDGKLTKTTSGAVIASFSNPPVNTIYFFSPNGKGSMWSSGSLNINVGDSNGSSSQTIANLPASYSAVGWYGNDYILVSKNNNQLFIMPDSGVNNQNSLFKVVDYQ